jgi:hypothetical protein
MTDLNTSRSRKEFIEDQFLYQQRREIRLNEMRKQKLEQLACEMKPELAAKDQN